MKTAIVGYRHMAGIHITCILRVNTVRLVAVCDQNETCAQEMIRHAMSLATPTRMLAEAQRDAVHALTPSSSDSRCTNRSGAKGRLHVFVEKLNTASMLGARAV